MIFLFAAVMYFVGGAIVGSIVGAVLGVSYAAVFPSQRVRRRGGPAPVSSACLPAFLCGSLGAMIGGGIGLYFGYLALFGDGPPHGYPDRASYRAAEMESRAKRLEPVIAALAKYKDDHGRYPAQWHDLVTEKYLDAMPPKKLTLDHQGQPGRVDHTNSYGWCGYSVSPAGDEFALFVSCSFDEDKRGMTVQFMQMFYTSATGKWQDGYRSPWPRQGVDPPPPAPKPAEVKKD